MPTFVDGKVQRVEIAGNYEVAESGCWLWTGSVTPAGYGYAGSEGAHRRSYAEHYGPIPHELVIDHICHNPSTWDACTEVCLHRRCVNPEHLEVVTPRENFRRGRIGHRLNLPPDWS